MNVLNFGWRNLSHSFCMVNQFQLVAMLERSGLTVHHQDLPMYRPEWNSQKNPAGFPDQWQRAIDSLPPQDREKTYDFSFSIGYPFFQKPSPLASRFHVAYAITELGLTDAAIVAPKNSQALVRSLDETQIVVTPSEWSRQKIVRFGIPEQKVRLVPHGVDGRLFSPIHASDRQALRARLGINPEDFCILNIGATTWNKGIEPLIRAFVILRRKYSHLRLILKDHSSLYGITAHAPLLNVFTEMGCHNDADMLASVRLASKDFALEQLRGLYSAADCYVSSYRAEGFNLPVLEAMACGIPVLATAGGATDDFVHNPSARIAARQVPNTEIPEEELRKVANLNEYHLEPELDDLVAKLEQRIALGSIAAPDQQLSAWALENFSWHKAVDQLLALPN